MSPDTLRSLADSVVVSTDTLTLSATQKFEAYYGLVKEISTISNSVNDNCLKILAGSVILLFGSNYLRPVNVRFRLAYLLFIPSWICIGISYYYSNAIHRVYASMRLFKDFNDLKDVIYDDKDGLAYHFTQQSFYFYLSIGFLSVWLITYLFWWVFYEYKNIKHTKNSTT